MDQDNHALLKQFPHSLTLTAKMVEVARTHKLQIMHVHYAIPFAAAAILARQIAPELDLKVVTTLHGTDITLVGASPSFKPVMEFSIEQSDAVTAVSAYLRDETYRQFSIGKEIDVVYNFMDPPRHHAHSVPCIPEKSSDRQVTLMHISNFRPLKRLGDVVRIFARVREKMDARLVLVGDGPEYGKTRELVESLGLIEAVRYVGVVDDVDSAPRRGGPAPPAQRDGELRAGGPGGHGERRARCCIGRGGPARRSLCTGSPASWPRWGTLMQWPTIA